MEMSDSTTVNRWFYLLPFYIIVNILDSNEEEKHFTTVKSHIYKGFYLFIYLFFTFIFLFYLFIYLSYYQFL